MQQLIRSALLAGAVYWAGGSAVAAELANGDFEEGLVGWTPEGLVTVNVTPDNDVAYFRENPDQALSRIHQVFELPARPATVSFKVYAEWSGQERALDGALRVARGKQRTARFLQAPQRPVYRRFVDPPVDPLTDFPRDSFSVFLLDPVTHERLLPPPGQPPEAFNEFFFLDNTGLVDYSPAYVSVTDPDADGARTVTLDISSLPGTRSVHLEFGLAGGPDGFTTFAVLDDIVVTRSCNDAADCNDGNDCTADVCNTAGICENPNEPADRPCGDPTDTACHRPDTCDGHGACQANFEPPITECRPVAGECDVPEFCTGLDADCPANGSDKDGTACGDDGNECTDDRCSAGTCTHSNQPMGTACGNQTPKGSCDNADSCDVTGLCNANYEPSTTECRAAPDECDRPEFCSGTGPACPDDVSVVDGAPCTADANECTLDICLSGVCTHPNAPAETPCGDPEERICDDPDGCDGMGACLPNYESVTTECRTAARECDVAEFCTGTSSDCPADEFAAAGTPCGDATSSDCDQPDSCDDAGACLANVKVDGTSCPDELFCDGVESCLAGVCTAGQEPCLPVEFCLEEDERCVECLVDSDCSGDGDPCTDDLCLGFQCAHVPRPDCGITAFVDIKPGSCPNPVNTQRRTGVVPVAIVGTASFDVHQVDVASLLLVRADGVGAAVSPISLGQNRIAVDWPWYRVEDVATPFAGELCDCHTLVGDSIDDLSVKFANSEVVDAFELDEVEDRTHLILTLTGVQMDGTPFSASDCIRVLRKSYRGGRGGR